MSYIQDYSCATCHGLGSSSLWEGLQSGKVPSTDSQGFLQIPSAIKEVSQSYREIFVQLLKNMIQDWNWSEAHKTAIIFASTKGIIEDEIWKEDFSIDEDTFSPILDTLIKELDFSFCEQAIVSTACTSSHAALELANRWLNRLICDDVLIISGDLIGPFTLKGFSSLRAISPRGKVKPFDKSRDGLILGDGLAAVRLSREKRKSNYKLENVYSLCEGVSATRPDLSGDNLSLCYKNVCPTYAPELIIAHGTGTQYNDQTESQAIVKAFPSFDSIPITCSKWSIGHTLGASGLIDFNLALEILERNEVPGIATLDESNLHVESTLLKENTLRQIDRILISSLGFGGMCAAMSIVRE